MQFSKDKYILIVSYFILFIGVIVCLGWFFDIAILKSVLQGKDTMKFNTAVCFILSGICLFLLATKKYKKAYPIFSMALLLLGGLLSFENLFKYSSGIDDLIIHVPATSENMFPGRPALATSFSFFLLGIVFSGFNSRSRAFRTVIQYFLNAVALATFVALVGYLYDIPSFYRLSYINSMALHTAFTLLLLSSTLIAMQADIGVGKIFTGKNIGGIMARRLFPQMLATILALGYLRLESHRHNLISVESGIAIYSVSFVVVAMLLILSVSELLNKIDDSRKEAENKVIQTNQNLEKIVAERTASLTQANRELVNSNERFFTVFDNNPVVMIISNMETTRFQYVNEVFLLLTGYKKEEVIGKTSLELGLIIPEHREKILLLLQEENKLKNIELFVRKKNGETFWSLTSIEIMMIDGIKFALTSFLNINDRKIAEEKLRRSEELFSHLFNNNPAAIYMRRLDDPKILDVNKSYLKLFGFASKEDVIGKTALELNLMVNPEQGVEIFRLLKENNYVNEFELEVRVKSGEIKYISTSIGIAEIDSYPCMFSVSMDISDRKRIELELVNAKEVAIQSGILKETFLANMSHEIRTPMNAIIGFTDLLLKKNLKAEEKDFVRVIKNSGENLLRIINDILDISKIDSGMMTFEEHPINIKEIFDSLKAMLAKKAEQKNLDLSFQYDARLPDMVLGDPTRLTQIILNLVGNAIKFTNKGNVEVYAKLNSVENEIYQVEFSVKDNGIGIPEDKLADIFERFKQAESHTTRNYGGTGLGLSIAKRLAELQGGTIAVTSKVGVGSVFTFILPFKKTDQIKSEKNKNFEENDIYGLGKLSILVVEDNPINIKFVISLFSYYKIHADIAENGIIAIEKIKNKNYDIVLMDIEMPQLNGYETTKVIRDELKLDIPIIAMTAHAMAGEKEKCQRLGMNDYVSKPIKSELLFERC